MSGSFARSLTLPHPRLNGLQGLVRFALIAGLLGMIAVFTTQPLAQALLPMFKIEIERLDDTFRVDRLYLDRDGTDKVVRVEVNLAHRIVVNGHVVNPDPRGKANASTLVWHVTVPVVLMIAAAFAWPPRSRVMVVSRSLALLPSLMLLWALDVPLILLASLWGLIFQVLTPYQFSILRLWAQFLQGGGELVTAVALGLAVGALIGPRDDRSYINEQH
jgi:hypothetical protein